MNKVSALLHLKLPCPSCFSNTLFLSVCIWIPPTPNSQAGEWGQQLELRHFLTHRDQAPTEMELRDKLTTIEVVFTWFAITDGSCVLRERALPAL